MKRVSLDLLKRKCLYTWNSPMCYDALTWKWCGMGQVCLHCDSVCVKFGFCGGNLGNRIQKWVNLVVCLSQGCCSHTLAQDMIYQAVWPLHHLDLIQWINVCSENFTHCPEGFTKPVLGYFISILWWIKMGYLSIFMCSEKHFIFIATQRSNTLMSIFVLLQKSKQVLQGAFLSDNCALQASTTLKLVSERLIRKPCGLSQICNQVYSLICWVSTKCSSSFFMNMMYVLLG